MGSVANGRFSQLSSFMKRLWVEEVKQKPVQIFLVVAGAMLYADHTCVWEVTKIREELAKERAKYAISRKRYEELTKALNAEQNKLVVKLAEVVSSWK